MVESIKDEILAKYSSLFTGLYIDTSYSRYIQVHSIKLGTDTQPHAFLTQKYYSSAMPQGSE